MDGFTVADWFGIAAPGQTPIGAIPKTESLRAHADGGNVGGTLSQSAANVTALDRSLLYWQAGLIAAALVILWALGALAI